ncbi:TPA: hypothetical protein MIN41_26970, partial [Klebsiella pneumoniae]|nr:hypothetical protein [Klebsiella pneumoniae]HBY0419494.1 hypothetical protein [Klebsiella variicola]HBX4671536.1 hypothetical protein [Klebsiella pneumoniae]HBX4714735.1 hypothetical protein [Klebsiella pneumoniae]HBY0070964.1 hypothetical protein [Klebsiella pneumoniae]
CVLPENPASYRVVRTKSYLFNKAGASATATFCPMKYNVQSVNLMLSSLLWYLTCPCHIMQYHTMNHPVPLTVR